jgi:branched-chain amino acid transport system substrate-binding protein
MRRIRTLLGVAASLVSFGAVSLGVLAASSGGASAEDIKIGMITPLTGPAAEAGRYAQWGAGMAVDEVNAAGGVMGRKLTLVIEDDQTTNPGVVTAFSKLSSQPDISAFIGSIRSTQVHAMEDDVKKIGKPMFIGGTDPTLTQAGNPWFFRARPNDSYSAKVIADFGVNTLKLKKWAIVHSTDAFGTNGMKALVDSLKALGVEPMLVQGYSNNAPDFTPVVLAVRKSEADVLSSYFTFEQDLGIFAKQLKQLGVTAPWVGSPSIVNATALRLAGPSLFGTYGVADYTPDSSPEAKEFSAKYEAKYKVIADNQSTWTYDSVKLLAKAMTDAKSTDPEPVRKAILAIRDYKGLEGTYNFDSRGDGLHGYNVVKNENGKIVFSKHIDFPQ